MLATSSMNLWAVSSISIFSARSSVVRHTRETSEVKMIVPIKNEAIMMPSGRCITLATRAYTNTKATNPNANAPRFDPPRPAARVTATAAEVIIAKMPVA
jgi:hypothetical protein